MKRSKTAIIETSPGTVWGRLCENREHRLPDEDGFPNVDATPAAIPRAGTRAFKQSLGIHRHLYQGSAGVCQPTAAHAAPLGLKPQKAQMTMIKGLWR